MFAIGTADAIAPGGLPASAAARRGTFAVQHDPEKAKIDTLSADAFSKSYDKNKPPEDNWFTRTAGELSWGIKRKWVELRHTDY